jgi:hypothetical protein
VDGGRDLDLARRGRSARCTRGGLAAGDAGRTRECDVGILVERSRSTAPKQIAAKVRESGTTPTEIAVIGPPVGATILGEVATSKGSGPGPPFPRCRERPRWLVLGALCRAECLPHRGEATPPHLRLDHRVAGWIARGIADGDQPSMAGWTDAPHAHATRGPLRRRRTRVHRRLERVPGRARGQDPDTARDLSGRRGRGRRETRNREGWHLFRAWPLTRGFLLGPFGWTGTRRLIPLMDPCCDPKVRHGSRCPLTMFTKQVSRSGGGLDPIVTAEAEQVERTRRKTWSWARSR